ncbi:hypothetical protein [Lysinibacillus pakistanensis]|uniref:Secreted protein n=1 Tax=Lysinibacillus pakistanensis TaxID=759811 RepID=A0ABX6DCN3_9BACI|nr:hypothetical protein GDS87_16755 [Lysinibacillus pakistanensis]
MKVCGFFYLHSAAIFVSKAKRQMFYARKRSGSGKCFMGVSEAAAANVICAKVKRQRQIQKTPTSTGGEMNAILVRFQWVSKHQLKLGNSGYELHFL